MPKSKRKKKKNITIQQRIERLEKAILKNPDEITLDIMNDVSWLIKHKKENELYHLVYTHGSQALEILIHELGYRLEVSSGETDLRVIPFAMPMTFMIAKAQTLPTRLPQTVKKVTQEKLLRQSLRLGDEASIILDSHLYPVNHPVWFEPNKTQLYLKNILDYISGNSDLMPLIQPFECLTIENTTEPFLINLVMCGMILVQETESKAIEETLFQDIDLHPSEVELYFRSIAMIIQNELEHLGVSLIKAPSLPVGVVELWDVPSIEMPLSMEFQLIGSGFDFEKLSQIKEQLMDIILEMEGKKILTISIQGNIQTFDIHDNGWIGYHPDHEILFEYCLFTALSTEGSLFVRQFLSLKTEVEINAKKIWIPRKNIYAVLFENGHCHPLPAETVREVSCTDAKTGKKLPPEQGVSYKPIPFKIEFN